MFVGFLAGLRFGATSRGWPGQEQTTVGLLTWMLYNLYWWCFTSRKQNSFKSKLKKEVGAKCCD